MRSVIKTSVASSWHFISTYPEYCLILKPLKEPLLSTFLILSVLFNVDYSIDSTQCDAQQTLNLCSPLSVHLATFSFTGNDIFFLCIFTEGVLTPVFMLLTRHE